MYRKGFMNRIKIALMGSHDDEGRVCVSPAYLNALWSFGAVGTLLPYCTDKAFLRETVDYFDGFLFCGGGDIDPQIYGEENSGDSKNICSVRDTFEMAMYQEVLASGKPILAICRGLQVMNAHLGGTLYQHIDGHVQEEPIRVLTQKTFVNRDSVLGKIAGKDEILTNSFHHQNIKVLGNGLVADAMSEDGYIEAAHFDGHKFCLGVQWHPEAYFDEDETSRKIFVAFIDACK